MQSPAVSYKASPAAASASIVSNDNESFNEDEIMSACRGNFLIARGKH
jgi:hypothetical protein